MSSLSLPLSLLTDNFFPSEGGIEGSEGGGGDGSNAVMDEVSFIMDVMDAPYLVNYGDLMLCNV